MARAYASKYHLVLAAHTEPHVPRHAQYDDFVRVAREILKGRTTTEQHALVKRALLSVMPRPVLSVLR